MGDVLVHFYVLKYIVKGACLGREGAKGTHSVDSRKSRRRVARCSVG